MRIKGGRAGVEPRRQRERRPPPKLERYHQDSFELTPVRAISPARNDELSTLAVVRDFAQQGWLRVAQDERRCRAELLELGLLMGRLTATLVVELINHFLQRASLHRSHPMVALGSLTSALFVEFWAVRRGDQALARALGEAGSLEKELGSGASQALEQFLTFLEETEGHPARRLAGTLYALE